MDEYGEPDVFEVSANTGSLKIVLENAEDGAVHLQKMMCIRDAGGRGETKLTHDFLFRSLDEFEAWWDNEKNRLDYPELMVRVKKCATSKLNTQVSGRH